MNTMPPAPARPLYTKLLAGALALLVIASFATLPTSFFMNLPQLNNTGCSTLQITPTDTGLPNPVPVDFNPRPDSTPGIPTSGNWTP